MCVLSPSARVLFDWILSVSHFRLQVRSPTTNLCLDNHSFLFNYPEPLYADLCHGKLYTQVRNSS